MSSTPGSAYHSRMMRVAACRSAMVSNSGETIRRLLTCSVPNPRSRPVSFISTITSSRSLTSSVWEMM